MGPDYHRWRYGDHRWSIFGCHSHEELHGKLGLKRKLSKWIVTRTPEQDLANNRDFTTVLEEEYR